MIILVAVDIGWITFLQLHDKYLQPAFIFSCFCINSFIGHQTKKRKHSISPDNTVGRSVGESLAIQIKQEPGTFSFGWR